jgi:hypothetical protein
MGTVVYDMQLTVGQMRRNSRYRTVIPLSATGNDELEEVRLSSETPGSISVITDW